MRIMIVGDGHSQIHEIAMANNFKKLNHHVKTFFWSNYFQSKNIFISIFKRLENKFIFGPDLFLINKNLIQSSIKFNPNFIFFYRATHIYPKTIESIKTNLPLCILCGYNNDDPFSGSHSKALWRFFFEIYSKI